MSNYHKTVRGQDKNETKDIGLSRLTSPSCPVLCRLVTSCRFLKTFYINLEKLKKDKKVSTPDYASPE
ncbi:MAG: hypothetical protein EVJ47_06505 [Candidatus Acidulodesulfobacterium ferriphilum]|uniref:Uncharacterized protein n=1 Tax=Candidatus Acidulodesulfobacterium ferriphilum TaxID=2597223 RepID=A0A519BAK5_9DELT|nr:MAG: hypothetical protein EVJ47_06505 [Candidatus Acidulodesulfobacterium ferriphilum]